MRKRRTIAASVSPGFYRQPRLLTIEYGATATAMVPEIGKSPFSPVPR